MKRILITIGLLTISCITFSQKKEILQFFSDRLNLDINTVSYYVCEDSTVKLIIVSYFDKDQKLYELQDQQVDSLLLVNHTSINKRMFFESDLKYDYYRVSRNEIIATDKNRLFDGLSKKLNVNVTSVCYYFRKDSTVKLLAVSYFDSTKNVPVDLIDGQLDSLTKGYNCYTSKSELYRLFVNNAYINTINSAFQEKGKYDLLHYINNNTGVYFIGCGVQTINDSLKLAYLDYYEKGYKQLESEKLDLFLKRYNLFGKTDYLWRHSEYAINLNR